MRKPTDHDFDQWIEEAIREEFQNSPPPPLTTSQAWEQLNQQLNGSRLHKNKWPFFKSKLFYAASALGILILILWNPPNGSAFAKLTDMFYKTQGSIAQLFISVGNLPENDENAPPEEFYIIEGSETTSETVSLEEAQKMTAFTIKIPEYVPADFALESVTVEKPKNALSDNIYVNYKGDQRTFTINEYMIHEAFGAGKMVDKEDTKIEEVNIHGQKGSLFTYKNDTLELIWVTPNYYFTISGDLTREEIIRIAEVLH